MYRRVPEGSPAMRHRLMLLLPAIAACAVACLADGRPWADPSRPYRVRVTLRAEAVARARTCAELPLDMGRDLERLGLPGQVDASSVRLVEVGRNNATTGIATARRDSALIWEVPATAANAVRTYDVYFAANPPSSPLHPLTPSPLHAPTVPDYATDAHGQGWDFNREGDFEEIDTFGDKPEYIRSRKVEEGLLKLDVTGDAYFIWGAMWGPAGRSKRPVAIDLARYPVLEMRVRQSVAEANWRIMGRPGKGESLVQYDFHVSGSGWQVLRIDLRKQVRWHGVLTALRIDPAKYVDAHVDVDWVRLLSLVGADRLPVEVRGPEPGAAKLEVTLADGSPRAGSEQVVTVRAFGADGAPVAGRPVRVVLDAGSGGALEADGRHPALPIPAGVRMLTGVDGTATVRYRASRRAGAGADRLVAVAEAGSAPTARLAVTTQAGAAARYTVSPAGPTILPRGTTRLAVVARLADALGNPVPGGGRRITWSAPGATLSGAATRTAPDGSARATLVCDPARRWVVTAQVRDAAGLAGESAQVCVLSAGARPSPVRLLPNGYFASGGKAWLPLGGFYANWVGTPSPDGEWNRLISFVDAGDEQVVAWLKLLKANGVTAQRFMLRAHRGNGMEPMDIGGRVNPGLFARFLHYLDLARPFGLRFQLVLHEDYTKPLYFDGDALEKFALPWYEGQDLGKLPAFQRRFIRDRRLIDDIALKYTDPDVMACQDRYAREVVGLLKGNPLVFGYELENEMVACPASWVNHQLGVIRSVDPTVPVCVSHSGGGLFTADPAWWRRNTKVDFYTPHLYPDPPSTSPTVDYGLAVDILMRYSLLARPAFLGESAGDQFAQHPDRDTRRWTMRDIIWFSLTNGAPGCFFWNARASEVAEFKLAEKIASRIDWTTFVPRAAPMVAAVPHPMANDQWFSTAEGRKAYEAMAMAARSALDTGAALEFGVRRTSGRQDFDLLSDGPLAPDLMRPSFHVSPGFQLKPLIRADGREALLYIRSFSGVVRWDSAGNPRTTQYLRTRAAAPLTFSVNLPGSFTAEIWDLDTGAHTTRQARSGETMDLGTTDHDWAVVVERR